MVTPPGILERVDTHFVHGLPVIDPFSKPERFFPSLINAVLATALFRCWHLILFFSAWATAVSLISDKVHDLSIQPTLLTVLGTVLGFVISYRTSSSFERYNEGRRLWSNIILGSRTFARSCWFHVPDAPEATATQSAEELKARTLVEKKTALNLIEAFAIAVKHYLRGEEGYHYEDLYHLVKFLPAYALPPGLPASPASPGFEPEPGSTASTLKGNGLPMPTTTPLKNRHGNKLSVSPSEKFDGQPRLLPARLPPKYSLFDVFPFSLLVKRLTRKGIEVRGKKAARERARQGRGRHGAVISGNLPLEITLYLSSYISALQARKAIDVATVNLLLNSLNMLVDALTGLERVLTTPIPWSYSIHLWTVTVVYVFFLPFQLWKPLGWLTIPGTAIAAFVFFGFLVCGEEIENPFGYDKNDLNLDHFTHEIIRSELQALTTLPVPDPAKWAFVPENDALFTRELNGQRITPEEWVARGVGGMREMLAKKSKKDGSAAPVEASEPPVEANANAPAAAGAGAAGAAGAAGGAAGTVGGGGGGGGDS